MGQRLKYVIWTIRQRMKPKAKTFSVTATTREHQHHVQLVAMLVGILCKMKKPFIVFWFQEQESQALSTRVSTDSNLYCRRRPVVFNIEA